MMEILLLRLVVMILIATTALPVMTHAQTPERPVQDLTSHYEDMRGSFGIDYDPSWVIEYRDSGAVVFSISNTSGLAVLVQPKESSEIVTLYQALSNFAWRAPGLRFETIVEGRARGGQIGTGTLNTRDYPNSQVIGCYAIVVVPDQGDQNLVCLLWEGGVGQISDPGGRVLRELVDSFASGYPVEDNAFPSFSEVLLRTIVPLNGPILFLSTRDHEGDGTSSCEAYAVRPDGSRQVRLTASNEGWTRWDQSLDRTFGVGENFFIVQSYEFSRDVGMDVVQNDTFSLAYKMQIEGGLVSWHPNLERLTYVMSEQSQEFGLFVMNRDTSQKRQITEPPLDSYELNPVWSPDGEWIAFDREPDGGLFKVRPDGSDLTLLTRGYVSRPAWSPDGTMLAFEASDAPGPKQDHINIWLINADGTEGRALVEVQGMNLQGCPAWSPDGRQIAFHGMANRNADMQVYVVNHDGTNLRCLTTDGKNGFPAWFPYSEPKDVASASATKEQDVADKASDQSEVESLITRMSEHKEKESATSGSGMTPSNLTIPVATNPWGALPVPSLPQGWNLYEDKENGFVMAIDTRWEEGNFSFDPGKSITFMGGDRASRSDFTVVFFPEDVFVVRPDTDLNIQFNAVSVDLVVNSVGGAVESALVTEAWKDGVYETLQTRFVVLDQLGGLLFHGLSVAIPKPNGNCAILLYMTGGRLVTEKDREIARQISATIRFGEDANAAAVAHRPTAIPPTPTPECFEYVGEVEGYADYPGMGILVKVADRDGNPIPNVKIHTHAFNTDFWDVTDADGAFKRDGFTQAIVWDVDLPEEHAEKLGVPFEYNMLVIVTFRLATCR